MPNYNAYLQKINSDSNSFASNTELNLESWFWINDTENFSIALEQFLLTSFP